MISQCHQNMSQTAFGRGFYTSEIRKIKKGKLNAAFEMGMAIGRGEIKAKDGAKEQLKHIDYIPKTTPGFHIAQELYFKLHEAQHGLTPRYRNAIDGLDHHEIHSVSIGHIPTIVELGVRFGQGVIMPERVLTQISGHFEQYGVNKHLKMLERHLQGFVAPKPMTPFQLAANNLIAAPLKAVADGITKILPKGVNPQQGADAFKRAFTPSQYHPAPQARAFEQAFAPSQYRPSPQANAFVEAFAPKKA